MDNSPRIVRDALMLVVGAAMAAVFGILVAYPAMLANSRENAARIEANQQQIELLWEAHQIQHETTSLNGGSKQ